MARYRRAFDGERRTAFVGIQLTPAERDELDSAARLQGAAISTYARELLFRKSAAVIAATQRNPEAKALMNELNALGNNLNQIARQLNTTGELREPEALREALTWHKRAIAKVLDL